MRKGTHTLYIAAIFYIRVHYVAEHAVSMLELVNFLQFHSSFVRQRYRVSTRVILKDNPSF